jgi:hypothetical protein
MSTISAKLTQEDYARHEALGIPPALLTRACVERVTSRDARERFGFTRDGDHAGLFYPNISPITGLRQTGRLRRDHPDVDEHGKPRAKYLSPPNDQRHLYVLAGSGALLRDLAVPIVFVEAEKSALALTAASEQIGRPLLAIATGGCWGWRGVIGKTSDATGARVNQRGPLTDLDLLALSDRDAVILFDSNARSNPKVRCAIRDLAVELRRRGGRVRVGFLPPDEDVNGPDDYCGRYGYEALMALVDHAKRAPAPADCTVDELLADCQLDTITVPVDLDALERRLVELQQTMREVTPLRRGTVRSALIQRLRAAKVDGAAILVDAALRSSEPEQQSEGSALADDLPWPAHVDGADLLDAIRATITRYLVLPPGAAVAITLWILHSYLMPCWQLSPLLVFWSAVKSCGKSNALTLISCLCPRALPSTNLTTAALFRLVERFKPTLVVDEMDAVLTEQHELRALVNSAYMRRFSKVYRCHPETLEPITFDAWCAKALALIGRLPDMTASRAILIEMKRKNRSEVVDSIREDCIYDDLRPLRQQATRWAHDAVDTLRPHETSVPDELPDRPRNNWRPLLCVADTAGGHWPETARRAARQLAGRENDDNDSPGIRLLSDIRQWFAEQDAQGDNREIAETATLLTYLAGLEERSWAEWRHDKPLSAVALARLLRPFGIHPAGNIRIGAKVVKGYRRCAFEDAWTRYCSSPLGNHPLHATNSMDTAPFDDSNSLHRKAVVARENGDLFNESGDLQRVAAQNPGQSDTEVIL